MIEPRVECIDEGFLREWLAQLAGRAEEADRRIADATIELEKRIEPLRRQAAIARDMMQHVQQMLDLLTTNVVSAAQGQRGTPTNSPPRVLSDIACEVLRELGSPTHFRDLADAIAQRGHDIRGRDPGTYLIAYIGRDPRFVRVKRGTYALVEWGAKKSPAKGKSRSTRKPAARGRRKETKRSPTPDNAGGYAA
jgi:hypothetical protein